MAVGRALRDERERAIPVGGDHDRYRHAGLEILRRCIKGFAELHYVETALTEGWADRRRRVRLTGRDLQFDDPNNLFCHLLFARYLPHVTPSRPANIPAPPASPARRSRLQP